MADLIYTLVPSEFEFEFKFQHLVVKMEFLTIKIFSVNKKIESSCKDISCGIFVPSDFKFKMLNSSHT